MTDDATEPEPEHLPEGHDWSEERLLGHIRDQSSRLEHLSNYRGLKSLAKVFALAAFLIDKRRSRADETL